MLWKDAMAADPQYWFAAKRYGWGWSLPITWQGWAVFVVYLIMVAICGAFLARRSPAAFVGSVLPLSGLLIGICWLKGEPPRWRWGP